MIFQHTWQAIVDGNKTMTRRVVKPGEKLLFSDDTNQFYMVTSEGRVRWATRRSYAVQPGRGKPAIARIRIVTICQEPLQAISEADAVAEGWPYRDTRGDFLGVKYGYLLAPIPWYAHVWDSINRKPGTRWADNPSVWVLTFEVEK